MGRPFIPWLPIINIPAPAPRMTFEPARRPSGMKYRAALERFEPLFLVIDDLATHRY